MLRNGFSLPIHYFFKKGIWTKREWLRLSNRESWLAWLSLIIAMVGIWLVTKTEFIISKTFSFIELGTMIESWTVK